MVSLLADQLRARLTVDGQAGARFALTLPVSGIAKPADTSAFPIRRAG
jgi:hypothetical protein